MSLCLRRSGAVTLSLYSTCCYLLISGVSRMHRALSCVFSPLPHALQDEESRNRRASETARARFLVLAYWCVARLDISHFLTHWLTDFANLRKRVCRVSYRHSSAPPHRTALPARFLFTSAFTRYQLRDRPRLHFTCSIVSYFWPPPPSPTTFIPALSSRFR